MESDNPAKLADAQKQAVAARAATYVQPGMCVGLGTGSTAQHLVAALIERVREEGLRFTAIPTSERTAAQARAGGLTLSDLESHPALDLTLDGADQVEDGTLNLIKGMGGALLREKIVAAASARLVIMVDASKLAPSLGLPIPVEVVRFGWPATARRIEGLGATVTLRRAGVDPFITDGGGLIVDCGFGPLAAPGQTDRALRDVVGVVETGLFIGRASEVLVAGPGGVRRLLPA